MKKKRKKNSKVIKSAISKESKNKKYKNAFFKDISKEALSVYSKIKDIRNEKNL